MGFVTDALGLSTRDPQQSNFKVDPIGSRIQLDQTDYNASLQQAINRSQNFQDADYNKLISALQSQASGSGPSVAQEMLGRSLDKNIGAAASMASSQRGTNPALAARMAMNAQQQAMTDTSGQMAALRAQEMLSAQNQLGGVLGQRGALQNQNLSTLGNLSNQYNQLQLQNALGAQGMTMQNQQFNTEMARENERNRQKQIGTLYDNMMKAGSMALGGGGGGGGFGGIPTGPGGKMSGAAMAEGGLVPGDHPSNDIVPAMLSPGEIVLPRSVTQAPDAAKRAMAFVEAIKNSKGKK